MIKFQREETVEVYAEVRDQDRNLVDPTESIQVTITDADGTAILLDDPNYEADMTALDGDGKFVYYYTLASDAAVGWWTVEVTVTDTGAKVTKTRGGFKVEA